MKKISLKKTMRKIACSPEWLFLDLVYWVKRKLFANKTHIVISSFPKSGSTLLLNVLSELLGYSRCGLVYQFEYNEQDIYLPRLSGRYGSNFVARQHFKATETNIKFLNQMGVTPVILVRDIFDIVPSLRDHFVNKNLYMPTCYTTKDFLKMDKSQQYDYVIDMAIPWYFSFFVSWQSAEKQTSISPLWISYESMVADKVNTIIQILDAYKIKVEPLSVRQVVETLDDKKARFNKGVAGRGKIELTGEQQKRIRRLATYYPSNDFSLIGI